MQAVDTRVLRASIDGREIDTTLYRGGAKGWRLSYSAPPPIGIKLGLTVPANSSVSLDLITRSPGVPPLETLNVSPLPPRLPDVVTVQTGDVTLVHHRVTF